MKALSAGELAEALRELQGWSHEDDALVRTFELGSFRRAMAFLVRVGFEAESLDHHPEIHNVYGTVRLRLTTHDAGNVVTRRDVALATAIDTL